MRKVLSFCVTLLVLLRAWDSGRGRYGDRSSRRKNRQQSTKPPVSQPSNAPIPQPTQPEIQTTIDPNWEGDFPDTLTLPITTINDESKTEPQHLMRQLKMGNTFSISFNMTIAPHTLGGYGSVKSHVQKGSNYESFKNVNMFNLGVSTIIGFMGFNYTANIFGEKYGIRQITLVGRPNFDKNIFTWEMGLMVMVNYDWNNIVIITNGFRI